MKWCDISTATVRMGWRWLEGMSRCLHRRAALHKQLGDASGWHKQHWAREKRRPVMLGGYRDQMAAEGWIWIKEFPRVLGMGYFLSGIARWKVLSKGILSVLTYWGSQWTEWRKSKLMKEAVELLLSTYLFCVSTPTTVKCVEVRGLHEGLASLLTWAWTQVAGWVPKCIYTLSCLAGPAGVL